MLQLLLNFLDALGRFPHRNLYAKRAVMSAQAGEWKAETLFKAWSPRPDSPWFPYNKATLFASLDSNKQLAATGKVILSRSFQDRLTSLTALNWVSQGVAIIADMSQDESVILAAHFADRYGFQPVALFNNWPDWRGLVNCESILVSLLALAPQMASGGSKLTSQSPPFFMVDCGRLGNRMPNENDFDNRYFLSEEDLPPAKYFKQHGIYQIYYIKSDLLNFNPNVETDDLNPYLCALASEGIQIFKVSAAALDRPESYHVQSRKTVLSSFSLFENSAFRRAAAGGFGALVPPRSSGG